MVESDPQKVSNCSSLLIHWTDPDESQDNATRIDELQRQTEPDRIEIENELELGLENSHSLSDDPERKCELESGPNSEESRMIEPEQEVQTNPNQFTYQEPEVEGTSGADADIIRNTKEQGEDTKEDKIQPDFKSLKPNLNTRGGARAKWKQMTKTTEMNKLWHCYLLTHC